MIRNKKVYAVMWGIVIPLFAFSLAFALVQISDSLKLDNVYLRLGSTGIGLLSAAVYFCVEYVFRKNGYTKSGITVSYFTVGVLLTVCGFLFASKHNFVLPYGTDIDSLRLSFKTSYLRLGFTLLGAAVVRLVLEFSKYAKSLKQ